MGMEDYILILILGSLLGGFFAVLVLGYIPLLSNILKRARIKDTYTMQKEEGEGRYVFTEKDGFWICEGEFAGCRSVGIGVSKLQAWRKCKKAW